MDTSENTYDGIILGAGHNSLVLQGYLGRAGLKTLCLEKRDVPGGGLSTMEDPSHPGFLHNTHSFFHRAINQMPWFHDLHLHQHGVEYIQPELNVTMLLRNGRALEWWTDFDKTHESFKEFNRQDADTLKRWHDAFLPIVENILIPEAQSPPEPTEDRIKRLRKSSMGRLLLEVSALSPLEFVQREFKNGAIQAGLLFFNGLREVDLRCKGFGHHIPALLAASGKAQMCLGGAAALARALVSAVHGSGGEIKVLSEPRKILVEGNRAVGVETSRGVIYKASHFVASGLNPHQTFLELIDKKALPNPWLKKANDFRYNLIAPLFAINLNLREPPIYRSLKQHPASKKPFMVIMGLEDLSQYHEIVKCHKAGTIPQTVMWGCCPTQHDPSQAPKGFHTAFMWEKLPYRLRGNPKNWDQERNRHGLRMLKLWTEFAPNLKKNIISTLTRSALDIERCMPNMKEGDLLVGAFTHGQIGYNRPFPGAGHYRSPIKGLYQCGSCCHPGGNITGLPGYNAAKIILSDFGIDFNPQSSVRSEKTCRPQLSRI